MEQDRQISAEQPAPATARDAWLTRVAGLLVRRRGIWECGAWLVTSLSVATLARIGAGALTIGVPRIFYLPAILIVTLFTGWECGVIAVVGGTALAWLLFFPAQFAFRLPNADQLSSFVFWILIAGSQVAIAQIVRLALQRALQSETRYRRLLTVASGTICVCNEQGGVDAPQAGWAELTGAAWPKYRGHGWLDAVHPDERSRLALGVPPADDSHHEAELRLWHAESGDWRWFLARSVSAPSARGGQEWITSFSDIHGRKLASDRKELMIGELRHRLKNLFTVIEALAKSSKSVSDAAVEDYLKRFLGRLRALGTAGDVVLSAGNVSIECGAVVRATLEPFMGEARDRFQISGPVLHLSEETGATLGLAVHEMTTNAVKYGALSRDDGRVAVIWIVKPNSRGEEEIIFEWSERGGPEAVVPVKEGFGMRLIRTVAARERNGTVAIEYRPEGFYCRIGFVRRHSRASEISSAV